MNNSLRFILIIIFLITVPFLIYAYLQIRSLDEDEKMATQLYEKQMETVLFSLNQYADEMTSRWMRKLSNDRQPMTRNAFDLTLGNECVQLLILRNMASQQDSLYYNDYVTRGPHTAPTIDAWYERQDSTLGKLTAYLNAGFQKIHPATQWDRIKGLRDNQVGLTAMIYDEDSALYNALFVLEPSYWATQILGPKMQEIDAEDFSLGVYKKAVGDPNPIFLYQTDSFDIAKNSVKKALWILPDMYVAIQPKGESYSDLISQRSQNNLYFLLFALLTVLIGAAVVIRNVRSTLKIAQLKSDFVSNVSHEIRTPLSLIRMYAETLMLGRVSSDEKKNHYYQIIHHESGRLTYLVNNILDFSRIEANRKTYHFEEKELNELVEIIYTNFLYNFKENKVSCELNLCPEVLMLSVDPQAFEEALSNLIENAIKYSNGSAVIHITTYKEEGFACCAVKDFGIGISKSAHKNIFEKFYRVEGALTQKTKGTGLGLSLIKHVMESHHGEVLVDSKPGQGSTFTLKFPLNQS